MRMFTTLLIVIALLPMVACSPVENQAPRYRGGAIRIDHCCADKISGELRGRSGARDLPGNQSRSVRRKRVADCGGNVLRMGGYAGSAGSEREMRTG
jgi:hypothetical protein